MAIFSLYEPIIKSKQRSNDKQQNQIDYEWNCNNSNRDEQKVLWREVLYQQIFRIFYI